MTTAATTTYLELSEEGGSAHKFYEVSVEDVRPVTRRTITSRRSTARTAPVLWTFDSGAAAFGIFIDEQRCWVDNEAGTCSH